MNQLVYPDQLLTLIDQLKRMPGIGPRGAERIALWLIRSRDSISAEISDAIRQARERVSACPVCGFFASGSFCALCEDGERSHGILCVIEQATDILPIERSRAYHGQYHVLGGKIAPLDHIGPENLRIEPLIQRIKAGAFSEVILALGADVEGEATANYLRGILAKLPLTISRIAQGLPAGGGLETADEITLSRALTGRIRL